MIEALDVIKESIKAKKISQSLKDDFNQLLTTRWQGIDDFYSQDISRQVNDQLDLMAMVQKIHRSESHQHTADLLNQNLKFDHCISQVNHPTRAHRIYLLPQVYEDQEVVLIGDLHSDPISLQAALAASNFFEKIQEGQPISLVFLGDYVDRGRGHLQMMDWLLALKYVFPHHVYLLRGNHDGAFIENNGKVNTPYRIPDYDDPLIYFPPYIRALEVQNSHIIEPILPNYIAFFESLALMAVFKSGDLVVKACHAGIARPDLSHENWYHYLTNLSDLTSNAIHDEIDRSIVQNIFWCDPTEDDATLKWDTGRFKYTQDHYEAYANHIGINHLYRGHEVVTDGIKTFFNGQVTTVYSTGDTLLNSENKDTAYPGVSPKIVSLIKGQATYLPL